MGFKEFSNSKSVLIKPNFARVFPFNLAYPEFYELKKKGIINGLDLLGVP